MIACPAAISPSAPLSRSAALSQSARADLQLYFRVRNLPAQLARARARVQQLEAEAARLGMRDLVTGKDRCEG